MKLIGPTSLLILLAATFATPSRAGEITDYLAADGKLKHKVTLGISSGGGGFSGHIRYTVWVIEPSGVWTRGTSEGYNATPGPIVGTVRGQLTKHRLAALAQHLAAQDFKALPDRMSFGRLPDVQTGAYSVEIEFGKKSARLTTVGGLTDSGPKAGDPKADEWSRFVALTLVLEDMLKEVVAEPKKTWTARQIANLGRVACWLEDHCRQLPLDHFSVPQELSGQGVRGVVGEPNDRVRALFHRTIRIRATHIGTNPAGANGVDGDLVGLQRLGHETLLE